MRKTYIKRDEVLKRIQNGEEWYCQKLRHPPYGWEYFLENGDLIHHQTAKVLDLKKPSVIEEKP